MKEIKRVTKIGHGPTIMARLVNTPSSCTKQQIINCILATGEEKEEHKREKELSNRPFYF